MGSSSDRKFVIGLLVLVFCAIAYVGDIRMTNTNSESTTIKAGTVKKIAVAAPSLAVRVSGEGEAPAAN